MGLAPQVQARVPAGLKLVKLTTSDGHPVWLNINSIKSFASVKPAPDIDVPDQVLAEDTFVTLVGENRGMKVKGTPADLIEAIKTSTVLL